MNVGAPHTPGSALFGESQQSPRVQHELRARDPAMFREASAPQSAPQTRVAVPQTEQKAATRGMPDPKSHGAGYYRDAPRGSYIDLRV